MGKYSASTLPYKIGFSDYGGNFTLKLIFELNLNMEIRNGKYTLSFASYIVLDLIYNIMNIYKINIEF